MIYANTSAGLNQTAVIINRARGTVINERELAASRGEVGPGGAARVVLDGDPPDPNSPIFNAPNGILTPHMAGSTHECLATIARMAGEDIARVLRGEPAQNPVNQPAL